MRAARFDTLTLALTARRSRRIVTGVLGTLALRAALDASLLVAETAAKRKKKHKKKHRQTVPPPPESPPPSPPPPTPPPPRGLRSTVFGDPNHAPVSIPASGSSGIASPYPSTITVSGMTNGVITDVNLYLFGLNHTFPDDVDILLTATHLPGLNAIVMSDVGGSIDVSSLQPYLNDQEDTSLPDDGPLNFEHCQPTNIGLGDTFPAPAPTPTGNSQLSVFNGQNPNGIWQLWVVDDSSGDSGYLAYGWGLQITAEVDLPAEGVSAPPVATAKRRTRKRRGK